MQARKVTCLGQFLIFTVLTSRARERPTRTSARMGPSQAGEIHSKYGNAPLRFEANQGQSASQVKFPSHGYECTYPEGSRRLELCSTFRGLPWLRNWQSGGEPDRSSLSRAGLAAIQQGGNTIGPRLDFADDER
jgi:hypothetical protein